MVKIAASIMCGDPLNFGEELDKLKESKVDMIHFDIMDGEFVPNIAMGLYMLEAMKKHNDIFFDVHMMVKEPDFYLDRIAKAGVELVSIHAEATTHLHRSVQKIKSLGMKAGVALNPATPTSVLKHVLHELDMVVVMTVDPGFSGQKFINAQLEKIKEIRDLANKVNPELLIQVDGNIGPNTIPDCVKAGADVLVTGTSSIFKGDRNKYVELVQKTKEIAQI